MKITLKIIVMLSFLLFSLTACVNTQDPRQGGILGGMLGEENYKQRIAERENNLALLQEDIAVEQNIQRNLEAEKSLSSAEVASLQAQQQALSRDVANLQRQISATRSKTAAEEAKRRELAARISTLERETAAAKSTASSSDLARLRAEEARLKKEVEALAITADALR